MLFLLPGDDLEKHTNHIVAIMRLLSSCFFVFSLATVEIALATAIAGFLHVVTPKLILLWGCFGLSAREHYPASSSQ